MPRYQLTPEDRYKGALATNKLHEAHGWAQQRRASAASRGKTHVFTAEERRRGGLVTAAKRRAARLEAIYLGGPEKTFAEVARMEATPSANCTKVAFQSAKEHAAFHAPDPFTLSALKRFRLGPLSPLSLTRSQRAHVQVMRDAGYLEATGDSMVQLTEKGRAVVSTECDENS